MKSDSVSRSNSSSFFGIAAITLFPYTTLFRSPASNEDNFRIEVVVRDAGIEITNGKNVIAAIPKKDDEFDLETLSDFMVELKQDYPNHDAASVLMEARIPYDYLIQVMDVVRSVEQETATDGEFELVALFSEISVGDAP